MMSVVPATWEVVTDSSPAISKTLPENKIFLKGAKDVAQCPEFSSHCGGKECKKGGKEEEKVTNQKTFLMPGIE